MKYSFAPMEGITGHVFRRVHATCFPGIDRYYTPFLTANQNHCFRAREKKDLAPENNKGIRLVPQTAANRAEDFVWAVRYLEDLGYDEINLNLGCPSPTVLRQHRGAAMLLNPEALDRFFDDTFRLLGPDAGAVRISVKTRSGFSSSDEFPRLSEILNRYPFSEVIIHPRTAEERYEGKADRELYRRAAEMIHHPLTYNGDIEEKKDVDEILSKVPGTNSVMIGRGLLKNPTLVCELAGGAALEKNELKDYHDRLLDAYYEDFRQERTVLFHMKELWHYFGMNFEAGEESSRLLREILKADRIADYRAAVNRLFREAGFSRGRQ
ncbi:MAG: tRNA-dihydrouridine synthase family protein [Lachnospiraceae bacterium]|nr:tRNA-dihydrouridine synthase family protein [Lachnospiraceae bacterium]